MIGCIKVDEYVSLLAEHAAGLGDPYARHLGEGVRELRPTLDGADIRITYWLTSDRTAVLLTVFRKTRMREDVEVERAQRAKKVCEASTVPRTRSSSAQSKMGRSSDEPQPLQNSAGAQDRRGIHRAR